MNTEKHDNQDRNVIKEYRIEHFRSRKCEYESRFKKMDKIKHRY